MDIKDFLINNWLTLIIMLIVYLFGFVTAYMKERVRNRAYIADIKRLEGEREIVRKEHQLDLEKRKYKYESKREQFVKYFNLIDTFTAKSNNEIQSRFVPMLAAYNEEYLGANGNRKKETSATTKFSTGIQSLMFEASENLIRLRGETNAIKIIADKKTLELIETMDVLYDKSFDLSSRMMKELSAAVAINNFDKLKQLELELKLCADKILAAKKLMIEQIRNELDEI